jgi:hypothetical protein
MARLAALALALATTAGATVRATAIPTPTSTSTPAEPLFPVLRAGRWGFIDRAGRLVIPASFDRVAPFSEGLAAARRGATRGYVDRTGAFVLVPVQEPVAGDLHRPFASGRAAVRVGTRFGYVDRGGRLAIPARFDRAEDFSEGLAFACEARVGCGYVDVDGRGVIGPGLMGGRPARGGLVPVVLTMAMGRESVQMYAAATGAPVGAAHEAAGTFADGLLPVSFGGRWGAVDGEGRPVVPAAFASLGRFGEGLAPARPEAGPCGYVDRTGAWVIPPRFRTCRPFSDGLAAVDLAAREEDAEEIAFVDRTGRVAFSGREVSPPFDGAADFAGGLAAVASGGDPGVPGAGVTLGYVDRTGRYVWTLQE